ncbi:M20/M25/M40 family metallo-hydrolase [Sphingomonas sp. RG327]|uniref:M20/M25/M40 family metallo-hydrolase n=1 Tax=Sphingomonas anseongensis TaxID=2908207 RepID=A0ABT0RGV8_9SPHN|nr:M20/M25/M40 family metallo-hydrolase [Sphingomonas anseongensis]MCL6679478.1 M20/M25/M40 family metallo-hydrolase [Sphingomonas anseongensis]
MKSIKLMLAPLALLAAAAAPAPQAADPAAAQRVRADVEFLASDLLEGRDTGSKGYDIGASYVASQFRAIGLKPGGSDGGWFEPVPFRRTTHSAPPAASMTIGRDTVALTPSVDFAVRPSLTEQVRTVDAPLVFVGHGVSDARLAIDDYAGLDVRGKIAVAIEGTPGGLASEVSAHLNSYKQATAAAHGAAGLIEIASTGSRPNFNLLSYYDRPVIDWVDPSGKTKSQSTNLGLVAAISRSLADRIFATGGKNLPKILATANKPGAMKGFDLPARLKLSDKMEWKDLSSPEVIGVLPGTDPALKDQYVVLMGHLDHLGVKTAAKPGEDGIYNGALDNAAGVATMLEAARQFVASGKPPRRSVLFIANTGEEKGLRGADYFAAHPTVPSTSIVGLVDLDMPLLLYPFTDVIAFGAEHSTVAKTVAEAASAMGVAVSPDPMPEETIFVRSDHYRFVTRGVPAILLMTGFANGGAPIWKDFLSNAYHKPNDDLKQPILWDQGARYAELNYRISRALADADQRPLWYQGDYFGDTFAPGQPRAER